MMRTRLLVGCLIVLSLGVGAAHGAGEALITGLDHEVLFDRLQLEVRSGFVNLQGMNYRVEVRTDTSTGDTGVAIDLMLLAVHPTLEQARANYEQVVRVPTVAPLEVDSGIADQSMVWAAGVGASGSVVLRRTNVVVAFSWSGDTETAKAVARRIDGFLTTDRSVASRGHFVETPEIVDPGFGGSLSSGQTVALEPVLRGLTVLPPATSGTPHIKRVALMTSPHRDLLRVTDRGFEVRAPAETGDVEATLVVSDARNVLATLTRVLHVSN